MACEVSKHAGGITALRDTATSNPVNAVATSTGYGKDITAPSVTPTADGSAIEILFGNNTGDNNGGEAWGVTSPLSLDWSTSTGASSSGNRTAGMALRVLTGGQGTPTGTFAITDLTGQSGNSSNAAITAAITPAGSSSSSGGGTPISLPKYAYLGAKQRNTTLPTGVIEMGARVYVPHIGRFLQTDPVYGGSANAYDYTNQDPVNNVDLDGEAPTPKEIQLCGSFFNFKKCYHTYRLMRRARKATIRIFGRDATHDQSDAFRHCYWSGLVAHYHGSRWAKKYGDAHEARRQPRWEERMDLNNNAAGRRYARAGANLPPNQRARAVANSCLRGISNGDLIVQYPR